MQKYFNTAGPCNETAHYVVPILERNTEIVQLVNRGQYFIIHAARQTGKTTLISKYIDYFNETENYYGIYCSLEEVQTFVKPEIGLKQILNAIKEAILQSDIPKKERFAEDAEKKDISLAIRISLTNFCRIIDKPLIVFFDEIDGLENGTLVSFLRQLRSGYVTRHRTPFVHSVALVGLRDIRDYKSTIIEGQETLGTKSPFNIIERSFTLNNFAVNEIEHLYKQHTNQTGQVFEQKTIQFIYKKTNGQPWLVNAVAKECIVKILKNNYSKLIKPEHAKQAIQNIILRRDTHIDSLLAKLKEERVRQIIEPLITGGEYQLNITDDNTQYCLDLGLISNINNTLKPANPIYSEVIIRALSHDTQYHLFDKIKNVWIDKSEKINMNGLLKEFQVFWRENSEIWTQKYQYKEAAPHLILQAFLQRIINEGGEVLREYAYGRR